MELHAGDIFQRRVLTLAFPTSDEASCWLLSMRALLRLTTLGDREFTLYLLDLFKMADRHRSSYLVITPSPASSLLTMALPTPTFTLPLNPNPNPPPPPRPHPHPHPKQAAGRSHHGAEPKDGPLLPQP